LTGSVVHGPGLRVFSLSTSCRFAAVTILLGAASAPLTSSPLSSYIETGAFDREATAAPINVYFVKKNILQFLKLLLLKPLGEFPRVNFSFKLKQNRVQMS
jgi:hypothetical protein